MAETLAAGLSGLNLDFPGRTRQRFDDYLALLEKWNRVYNLTAVRDMREMVSQHLLDSLAVLPHLDAPSILDVGSGAGLPGIPLALARPEVRVTLLDANQKKAAFLRQAVIELEIENASVVCARVESWATQERYAAVISRAFSELRDFLACAGRLCAKGGVLAAMKGEYPHDELARIPGGFEIKDVVALDVPGLRASRHLVLVQPV